MRTLPRRNALSKSSKKSGDFMRSNVAILLAQRFGDEDYHLPRFSPGTPARPWPPSKQRHGVPEFPKILENP